MPSKEEMREASTRKIMETALELFAVQGFHSTSMNKIAKEAGVSKGLIYNYYESKDALLFAIVAYALEVGKSIMEPYKEGADPKESLKNMILEYRLSPRWEERLSDGIFCVVAMSSCDR